MENTFQLHFTQTQEEIRMHTFAIEKNNLPQTNSSIHSDHYFPHIY